MTQEEIIAALLRSLQRLVTDYQDVPDATDADGQAVFEDARKAIALASAQDIHKRGEQ